MWPLWRCSFRRVPLLLCSGRSRCLSSAAPRDRGLSAARCGVPPLADLSCTAPWAGGVSAGAPPRLPAASLPAAAVCCPNCGSSDGAVGDHSVAPRHAVAGLPAARRTRCGAMRHRHAPGGREARGQAYVADVGDCRLQKRAQRPEKWAAGARRSALAPPAPSADDLTPSVASAARRAGPPTCAPHADACQGTGADAVADGRGGRRVPRVSCRLPELARTNRFSCSSKNDGVHYACASCSRPRTAARATRAASLFPSFRTTRRAVAQSSSQARAVPRCADHKSRARALPRGGACASAVLAVVSSALRARRLVSGWRHPPVTRSCARRIAFHSAPPSVDPTAVRCRQRRRAAALETHGAAINPRRRRDCAAGRDRRAVDRGALRRRL
eukprot:364849-Chlamydomonas_euryale.AAC.19